MECEQEGFWWVHLRRCAACGHIGCCDDSLRRHATAHALGTGHNIIRSFEPGENWFWDYATSTYIEGPPLVPPVSHPASQSVPGPADRLPPDWQEQLAVASR
jgi:Zn-finger in ubiquitin-hydrolases and other protein